MSTGRLWEMYSTMTVQKNSGFQWSGNFSQPPSAMGNKKLNIQNLISEQKYGNKKRQLHHNQNKHSAATKVKLKYTLGLGYGNNNKHWE